MTQKATSKQLFDLASEWAHDIVFDPMATQSSGLPYGFATQDNKCVVNPKNLAVQILTKVFVDLHPKAVLVLAGPAWGQEKVNVSIEDAALAAEYAQL